MDQHQNYISPYSSRYASKEMQYLFSDDFKFSTWRKMWIALAKAEQSLGLPISDEQISEMEEKIYPIDYDLAKKREKEVRHDVMSHVYAFGKAAPKAKPIIHLGATSCYVTDNTELIQMEKASKIILNKAGQVVRNLADFAEKYKDLPCMGYTHLQPAQLTTVGKRACLWIHEMILAIQSLQDELDHFCLRGAKGTTGTQASFIELFNQDEEKVKALDLAIAKELGYQEVYPVTGQTYSRQVDFHYLSALANFAIGASKFANDLRILQSFEELEEPFESTQIGSSAMPYKRNPMRSERICALSRHVIVNCLNPAITASTQWFERTLDDSANRRLAISEAFLGVDSILNIAINISQGITVFPGVIRRRVMEKLPYMATENIMMESVKRGKDRQAIHERIREHSHAAVKKVKVDGGANDLIERIAEDPEIPLSLEEIQKNLDPALYVGRAPSQVEEYLKGPVQAILDRYHHQDIEEELSI